MIHPSLTIVLHTNAGIALTILVALALIVLAIWSYRWTRPPLPVWARVILAILRALAFVAVWFLVTGFEVRWVKQEPLRPDVVLLLDASESMSFTDSAGDRADTVRAILDSPVWDDLRGDVNLERAVFAADLEPWPIRGVPAPDGPVSDVEAALTAYASRPEGPPNAFVLISDGAFNRDGAYTAAAQRLGVPVYPVAVGDSSAAKDLVISSLVAPELAYSGEPFPLDITVRAAGAGGEVAKLRVVGEDGQVIATQDVLITGTWSEQTVTLNLTPQRAGVNSWTVEVEPLRPGGGDGSSALSSGEVDTTNNRRRAVIKAAERRRTVLVLSPAPNSDAAAVARALEEDPDTDVIVVIGGGLRDKPVRGSWDDLDPLNLDAAMIFLQGPWSKTGLDGLSRIASADKLPTVWFTGSEDLSGRVRRIVAQQLGNPQLSQEPENEMLRPVVAHPLFTESGGFFEDGVAPPILRGPYRAGAGETLAVTSSSGEEVPAIIVSRETPRTMVWFVGELAAWDRIRRTEDPGGEGFHALLDRMLRWLTGGGEEDRVFVKPEQSLYAGGEEVRLVASVADPGLNPVEDARVTATVTRRAAGGEDDTHAGSGGADDVTGFSGTNGGDSSSGSARIVEFQSLGGGRYLSTFLPWGEGRYSFSTTVETSEETVTREGEFVVDRFDLETAERRMRPDRLRALADATGGTVVWSPANLDTLLSLLPRSGETVEVRGAWRPFGLWFTLLLVAGVLAVEWIARTRTGMA